MKSSFLRRARRARVVSLSVILVLLLGVATCDEGGLETGEIALDQLVALQCDSDTFNIAVANFMAARDSAISVERLEPDSAAYDAFMDEAGVIRFDEALVTADQLEVNEVHDCQRMITTDAAGDRVYGPLVGILVDRPRVRTPATPGQVVAELVNFTAGQHYEPLGITDNPHCLWMGQDAAGDWRASILLPGAPTVDEPACQNARPATARRSIPLTVAPRRLAAREPPPDLAEPDADTIPSTARWLWDDAAALQYIGIRCGDAWCELSPSGVTPDSSAFGGNEMVPGWYDEQYLALYSSSAASQVTQPSGLIGTITPGPGARSVPAVGAEPVRAATIAFAGNDRGGALDWYREKLRLHGSGLQPSQIMIRQVATDQFTAFDNAGGVGTEAPLKRLGRAHSGTGTVRWRWLENDERGWIPCRGCCTL